jgi:hypothetical protein
MENVLKLSEDREGKDMDPLDIIKEVYTFKLV